MVEVNPTQYILWRIFNTGAGLYIQHPIAGTVFIYGLARSPFIRTIAIKGAADVATTSLRLSGRLIHMIGTEAIAARQAGSNIARTGTAVLSEGVSLARATTTAAIGSGATAALLAGSILANSANQFNARFLQPENPFGI